MTPPAIKDKYADRFDPCPHPRPEGFDGLEVDWGEKAFVNPPWRNIRPWVEKAMAQAKKGCCVHMLLAVVTSTRVFHDLIFPNAKIEFIRGDVKYFNVKSGKVANRQVGGRLLWGGPPGGELAWVGVNQSAGAFGGYAV